MHVGILEVSFHVPESCSLKEKRKIVASLKDRIRHKFNVSLAEIDGQNTWQQSTLAFSMVSMQKVAIDREFNFILSMIEERPEVVVTDHWIEYV